VPNSFKENVCENANTLTHVVDHMVVLAHLRRRWSLSGREGLGSSLPPADLARRDSGVFEELKRLFSTTPEVRKETEVTEVTGCWTGRGLCLTGHVRSVFSLCACFGFLIRRGDASSHSRSDASGRSRSLLDSNRTLALWRPVSSAARPVAVLLCAAQA
jgi:hypothetical protein